MLQKINEKMEQLELSEFTVLDYTGDTLTIAGSKDLLYYHDIEIQFLQTTFICLPTAFFKFSRIRKATVDEWKSLQIVSYGYQEGVVFCLEEEIYRNKFYIAAQSIRYFVEHVAYFK